MKKYLAFTLVSVFTILILTACSKNAVVLNNNNNNNNNNSTTLLPLTAGNIWVYQDSAFSSANVVSQVITDSAYVTSATTAASGIEFYNFVDPYGWFGPYGYFATASDQYGNNYILEMDSANTSPYTFFETASADQTLLGTGHDFTDPSCVVTYQQYGFASTTLVDGFTCYKNFITGTNCSNVNTENIVEYVSPGVGIVRVEDWEQDTTQASKPLYLSYSQTLTKYIPK